LKKLIKKQILGSEIDSYRVALTNSLSTYLNESFKPNKTNFCVYGSDNGQLTIVISAKNINYLIIGQVLGEVFTVCL